MHYIAAKAIFDACQRSIRRTAYLVWLRQRLTIFGRSSATKQNMGRRRPPSPATLLVQLPSVAPTVPATQINPSCLLRQSNGTGHTLAVFLVTVPTARSAGRPSDGSCDSSQPLRHTTRPCASLSYWWPEGQGVRLGPGCCCACVTERPISDETTLEDGKSAVRDRRAVPMDQPAVTLARPMRPPLIFLPAHVSILVGWYTRHLESGRPNEPHHAPTND